MYKLRFYVAMGMMIGVAFFLQGCISISKHSFETVNVLVRDAETGEPIPYATVSIQYIQSEQVVLNKPDNIIVETDEQGRVHFQIANYDIGPVAWTVSAEGYIKRGGGQMFEGPVPKEFRVSDVQLFGSHKAEIQLYREPRANLKIVVPDGYTGALRISYQDSKDRLKEAIGKREFEYWASDDGNVLIDVGHLREWNALAYGFRHISVRYADGTEIRPISSYYRPELDNEIGLRPIRTLPFGGLYAIDVYVIGTKIDEDLLSKVDDPLRDQ